MLKPIACATEWTPEELEDAIKEGKNPDKVSLFSLANQVARYIIDNYAQLKKVKTDDGNTVYYMGVSVSLDPIDLPDKV